MDDQLKEKVLAALTKQKEDLDKIVADFTETIEKLKKDAFKEAEAADTQEDDQAAEDLLKDV